MPYTFTPPTYLAAQPGSGVLLVRYRIPRGYTVVKRGSSYEQMSFPSQDVWKDADMVYQGGHVYEITDAEAALLQAAGYTVTEV